MSDSETHIDSCGRCGAEHAPRIDGWIPFSGDLKEYVASRICASCWSQWQNTQLMAINEYRLNLGRPEHQQVLRDLASEYLRFSTKAPPSGEVGLDHLQGQWSPPSDDETE